MATGDQPDILTRLQRLIPSGWFPAGYAPLRDAMLSGAANAFAFVYNILAYVRLQTRIATATDGFLDLIAYDFFGNTIFRKSGQTDASLRATIAANIFRERGTRRAVVSVLRQLTNVVPGIFEPARALDTGGYNVGTLAYNTAGGYGSILLPYQSFVQAYSGGGIGIPNVAGYGVSTGGYSTPSQAAYEDPGANQITYGDIYAAINSVRPIGYTIWARITAGPVFVNPVVPVTAWTFDSSLVTFDSLHYTMDGG